MPGAALLPAAPVPRCTGNRGVPMRTAIVTGDYMMPGQTYVNRHIEHLFGGDTVVIASEFTGTDPLAKPGFYLRDVHRPVADRIASPVTKTWNRLARGTSRVPYGATRAALIAFLRAQRVEALLAEFGTKGLWVAHLARQIGLPCFCYFRGADASFTLRKPSRVRGYRHMVPQLTGVFAVSRFLLDNLAAIGITHPNAHVVPSGVDVRRFAPGTKVPGSHVAIGRMVEKKAPRTTLRAFAEATRDAPRARLRFIGDGPELEPTRALARDLGVMDRVSFDGALPHDQVRAALAETEVFLQHSVTASDGNTEGLPTAIQEAMASGCLVISTRHAGIPEAVDHGVNGWLCDEHDEAGFAALIASGTAPGSDARVASMRAAARATAEARFDNRALLAQVEKVMRSAVRPA